MTKEPQQKDIKVRIQRFGSFLSGMIMPNIGAFIAWGLITALFIPTGWRPNASFAELVDPILFYLLPILIGFTGGRIVYDIRGGVVGATLTMGVIVGADIPMFLGAMIVGPLGGWVIKKFDKLIEGKVKSGFEMLVNNFSAGIIGGALTLVAYKGIGPLVEGLNKSLAAGVQVIVDANLLPIASVFIEPGKVLFLNNAINHGVLSPIGIEQSAQVGKSILFLLESNPGPGFGILLAYMFFGRGMAKQTASGAGIIHFLGGIHEIYFPYILMRPLLLVAAISGGAAGVFTFQLLGAGLVAAASPGSIFAILALTPRGGYFGVIAGVLVATAVSFIIAALILKTAKQSDEDDDELAKATEKTSALKGKESRAANLMQQPVVEEPTKEISFSDVKSIIFACDAGMGSSAMGAGILRNKVKKADLDIAVSNMAINNLPADAKVVITHKDLTERAQEKVPTAYHISVENFLNSPKYDELLDKLQE
ncbi:PTS mannitol transporter subunit IICB [Sporosarcina sp. Marseille-Q4063]|uniref:PTS mannitol transporter subunit IICB n=1 Tax=Sporosarcina sp. Marseille-Q4063 TaxID=2810514 RepID=UPI001BB0A0EA|nr:PTS mannitol transporter subunit IICB [Sporosarcina sp. Marseille-Q4063]QUW22871.1 PTS mannitol transporter subunit IICB [Sporosarcina sp. Marseille-Q4063]